AAELPGWRADHRGFGELPGFAAAEGHSPGDEKRDACGGNHFRGAEGGRYVVEKAERFPEENRRELHQKRTMASAKFSPVVPARNAAGIFSHGVSADFRRARADRPDARARGA